MHYLHFKMCYFAMEIHYLHFKKDGSEMLPKVKYVKVRRRRGGRGTMVQITGRREENNCIYRTKQGV